MTAGIVTALTLAAASAVALNWGFFVQHEQATLLPPLRARRPLASLRLLFANTRWLLGFGVGLVGWAIYVAALRFGPLSLVQAASAGGIGVLALLVERRGDARLVRREWTGVWLAVAGLALLGLSLEGHAVSASRAAPTAAVAGWALASAAIAAVLALSGRGAALGAGAGVLYAAGDVATKAAVGGHVAFVAVVLAAHGLGFLFLQLAFQRGGAVATAGLATVLTNSVPIAAGTLLFGERIPSGALGAARVLAFAAVVAGAALLARGERR
jgi:hypothetical protein